MSNTIGGVNLIKVSFHVPKKIFIGSFTQIAFDKDSLNACIHDFTYEFIGDPGGCRVSIPAMSNSPFTDSNVLLIAGHKPGIRKLMIQLKGTTHKIIFEFEVVTEWENPIQGPPATFWGMDRAHAPTMGGVLFSPPGGTSSAGQKTIRIALLTIGWLPSQYSDGQSPANDWTIHGANYQICKPWLDYINSQNKSPGQANPSSGDVYQGKSVRLYYNEVSTPYGATAPALDIDCRFMGDYLLQACWNDCFDLDPRGRWLGNANLVMRCFSSALQQIEQDPDFCMNLDMLFIVVRPTSRECISGPMQYATETLNAWSCWIPPTIVQTTFGAKCLSCIVISDDVSAYGTNVEPWERAAHEIGHGLYMQDLRSDSGIPADAIAPSNPVADWDLMANDATFPHLILLNRRLRGYINDRVYPTMINRIELRDLVVGPSMVIPLNPLEKMDSNQCSGLELFITEGWSFFFEFRSRQSSQIADQNLGIGLPDNVVLGIENKLWGKAAPYRQVELLSNMPRGSTFPKEPASPGGTFSFPLRGSPTIPSAPWPSSFTNSYDYIPLNIAFSVEFLDITNGVAEVQLNCTQKMEDRPDPCIQPWKGYEGWQSPDIIIQTPFSSMDPSYENQMISGSENTIIARVRNKGNIDAVDVKVKLAITSYSTTNPSQVQNRQEMMSDPITIGRDQSNDFTFFWDAPADLGHICISAEIVDHINPNGVKEITRLNNFAQSNFIAITSPTVQDLAERKSIPVEVTNPYEYPVYCLISSRQNNPLYRIMIDRTKVRLGPKESKKIMVFIEYVPKPKSSGDIVTKDVRARYEGKANGVSIEAFFKPTDLAQSNYLLAGGANIVVRTGLKTRFKDLKIENSVVSGSVCDCYGKAVATGKVLLSSSSYTTSKRTRILDLVNGTFQNEIDYHWRDVKAYYLPGKGYCECISEKIENR